MNEIGRENGQQKMSGLGDLPVLQDVPEKLVWASWNVTYRDVVILDEKNECYAVYNLTGTSLEEPENYAALKALFEAARNGDPSPGCQ